MARVLRLGGGLLLLALAGRLGAEDLPPPPGPDLGFYEGRVAPWIEERCAPCHRGSGVDLRLLAPAPGLSEAARRRRDFVSILAFVDRARPAESALLRKVLAPAEGGDFHAGGVHVRRDEAMFETLLDFVAGATLRNLPPEPWLEETEVRARTGEVVRLDASSSYDRDEGDRLAYRWSLRSAPPGAQPSLSDARAARLEFRAGTGGTYVLALRVGDGSVWSHPLYVTVEVLDALVTSRRAAGRPLEEVGAGHLARIRRLYLDALHRPPTPVEVAETEAAAWPALVAAALRRPEASRAWVEAAALRLGMVGEHRPSGEESSRLALRLAAEGIPPPAAEATLVRDPSFLRAHPPGRALAEALAERLLDREATAGEVEAALRLAAGEPAEVPGVGRVASSAAWIARVLDSEAFRDAALLRRLSRFLPSGGVRRAMPRARAAAREGGGAWLAFLEETLADDPYREGGHLRPKDDLTFLRGLFVDLLGRLPTEREWTGLWHALHVLPGRTAPRAAVVKILLDSGTVPFPLLVEIRDARAWIVAQFLRYLGRRPTNEEVQRYGAALLDVAGGPEVVVLALLTGPEYACR